MKIGKFILKNAEKLDRAINGTPTSNGMVGGVVDANGKYKDEDLLVEYDKIGGYITNSKGDKVVTGSFYDVKNKKAFDKPKVSYVFRVNGEEIVVEEGEEAPKILEAVKILDEQKAKKTKKVTKK